METATFATTRTVPAILRPTSTEQVQECARIATRNGIPLYPVSGGKNWGYGSRVPTADAWLLDLAGMNRIIDFSEEHAYITVEAGVTQQQVFDFLAAQGSGLFLDCTGASPHSSVIGNTVERGFGHTPYGDHFANCCHLEVVLATGERIETGYGRFPGVAATPTYRWGVGPILDGLFSQSNFGIVTRMTVWLMPQPEYFQAFFFRCDREEMLPAVIDSLRPLRLDGTLKSASHIGNHYKVISGIQQYPWDRTNGETPLRGAPMDALCREFDIGRWNGSGALYGTPRQVSEARRLLKRALAGKVSRLQFLDDRMLSIADRFATPVSWLTGWNLKRTLELVRPIYGLMRGIPTDYALRSVYWRKQFPAPDVMDPDGDRCGLIWCAPVAPIAGHHAARISAIASKLLLEHAFEPMLSITLLTERTFACVISISYDRDVEGEDERAISCQRALVEALTETGYQFYRLGILFMAEAHAAGAYSRLLSSIKGIVDPAGILAPGRYERPS